VPGVGAGDDPLRGPTTTVVRYPASGPQPTWDDHAQADQVTGLPAGGYIDPDTGSPLPTWEEAMAELDERLDNDPEIGPEYVVRFGPQLNMQGVLGGTAQADKLIGYLTKYLTKTVADSHRVDTATAAEHHRRLWEELRYAPCSPRCANWLRYGIAPHKARPRLRAGHCRARVHQPDSLGIGGRRVLVSRQWSGKTLADHRHDQAAWVRRVLGVLPGDNDAITPEVAAAVEAARAGGAPAPIRWDRARPEDRDLGNLATRLLRAVSTRIQHKAALAAARRADPPIVSAVAGGGREPPTGRPTTTPTTQTEE
jgi:hypothetical protein